MSSYVILRLPLMVRPFSPAIPPGHKPKNMKTLTETQLLEITGGELNEAGIHPLTMWPGWNPAQAASEQAIADFLAWWAHYTQSLGLSNGQQAD